MRNGQIVTVIDRTSSFYGYQGTVKPQSYKPEPPFIIAVEFGQECQYLLGYDSELVVLFRPQDLQKDSDWSFETKVKRYFRQSMRTAKLLHEFGKSSFCMHEQCLGKRIPATTRIAVNILGTVVEYEACDHHKAYDCKMVEYAPFIATAQ